MRIRKNKDQRGFTFLETILILMVFFGLISLLVFPDLKGRILGTNDNPTLVRTNLAESTADLLLAGGVVGTANPAGTALDSIVFRITRGGRSLRAVDVSANGATVSYLDDFRAFRVPKGQWSAVWRRGNGPFLDGHEVVEIQVDLHSLYPPLGKRTSFAIRVDPAQGSPLIINRTTPSKLRGFMELKQERP